MNLTELTNLHTNRAQALKKHGIETVDELLQFFPHRYVDRTQIHTAGTVRGEGETVTVIGYVKAIYLTGRGRKKRLEVIIEDDGGQMKGVWFRGADYFHKLFKKGSLVSFFGTVKTFGRSLSMAHPEVETLESKDAAKSLQQIVPIYPSSSYFAKTRITHKLIHSWINEILEKQPPEEFIPEDILERYGYPLRQDAFQAIHNPVSAARAKKARDRFKFEELFLFELSMARVRYLHFRRKTGLKFSKPGTHTSRFFNHLLPFSLTPGQTSALQDIRKDLASGLQMHRLVQGDVGAGKTVVALGAMLLALDHGYQAAFMAPTEILAEQHFHTLSAFLGELELEIRFLKGGQKTSLRTDVLTSIEGGHCQIVVGTHAIIQEKVRFHKLGLAVIDEQHRFGVKQRADILDKGDNPHLLVMSATPIPRSLAMSVYSDLDISMVKGLPAGRKPIRTAIRTDRKREDVYAFLHRNAQEGGQAFIVYPLVEESEVMDLKDATLGFEKLTRRFPELSIGLIHGRMNSEEKEHVMQQFNRGRLQILVSTTVIEVGVDVPNANVMVIEHAERFGLSQLHQLRGRIGRGDRQSYCILIPGESPGKAGRARLKKMTETSDGFEIAEEDLRLRGPGDFLGTKQSGLPDFRHADIVEDQWILEQAKNLAWEIMGSDPGLESGTYRELKQIFEPYYRERSSYLGLG